MKRNLVLLGIALLLTVGTAASGQSGLQLDEGPAGGRGLGNAVPAPPEVGATPIVVCPDGNGAVERVRVGRLTAAGVMVMTADGTRLFDDSGRFEPGAGWDENGPNRPVSVWLSRADCVRADRLTAAVDHVDLLVLFDPPELIVPDTERFTRVVVVTSNAVLAEQFLAVAELYRGSGFGDDAFVVLKDRSGRDPAVEQTVVALLTDPVR